MAKCLADCGHELRPEGSDPAEWPEGCRVDFRGFGYCKKCYLAPSLKLTPAEVQWVLAEARRMRGAA